MRILAVDLRSQRFGVAVLEGQHTLLEWGVKSCPASGDIGLTVQKRLASLAVFFDPEVIVLTHVANHNREARARLKVTLEAISQLAQQYSAEVVIVRRDEIQQVFEKSGNTTKYGIACQVALHFPELTWKLPPARMNWMKEHYNMTIFDAVAAGLTYLARLSDIPLATILPETRTHG